MKEHWVDLICDACGFRYTTRHVDESWPGKVGILLPVEGVSPEFWYCHNYDLCEGCAIKVYKLLEKIKEENSGKDKK